MSEQDPTEDELEIRLRGLESVFGAADETLLHGLIPFFFGLEAGGRADVVTFSAYDPDGILYVTCELVGNPDQPANSAGQYELAVCQPDGEQWALDLILGLAHYTLETPLDHGHTMDLAGAAPKDSDIVGFVFKRIAEYVAFDAPANVICCIGITQAELDHCLAHGSASLFEAMPDGYVLTTERRAGFVESRE